MGRNFGQFVADAFCIAAFGMLLAFAVSPRAEARDRPAHGGGGGGDWRAECYPKDALIGIDIRNGTALDAVSSVCTAMNGTEWAGKEYAPTQAWGGAGGNYQRIVCNSGEVVRALRVSSGPWGDLTVVKHVAIECLNLKTGYTHEVVPQQVAGTVGAEEWEGCDDATEIGTGLYGGSGTMVDRIGLVCGEKPVVAQVDADAQAKRAAEIADERNVLGRTPEECLNLNQRCKARCLSDFGPGSVGIGCEATECRPFFEACMNDVARRAAEVPPPGKTATAKNDVNVHEKPDGNSRIIGIMRGGKAAEALEAHPDGWCRLKGVADGGVDGWVAVDHLSNCL